MSAIDDILGSLPLDQLAQQVDADPQQVEQAAAAAIPALLGGLQANAEDGGAGSILEALDQHDGSLLDGGVDLEQVDPADGQKIASHIFGSNQDQVINQLGGVSGGGAGSALIRRLLPILAPIVLSYIAKQVLGGGRSAGTGQSSGGGIGDLLGSILGGGREQEAPARTPTQPSADRATGAAPGSLEDMLKDVLGSATGTTPQQTQQTQPVPQQTQPAGGLDAGSIITNVLGGLLGGGRR